MLLRGEYSVIVELCMKCLMLERGGRVVYKLKDKKMLNFVGYRGITKDA